MAIPPKTGINPALNQQSAGSSPLAAKLPVNQKTKPPIPPLKKPSLPTVNSPAQSHQDGDNEEEVVPVFDKSKVHLDKGLEMIEDILDNMKVANGTGLMLAGEPGVGKTTFIKRFSKLIGIPVIVIEAPHVTEEHLINIPFLVFNPVTGASTSGSDQIKNDFSVKLAKSHLASQLDAAQPVPDEQYMQLVAKFDSNLQQFFSVLGGSAGNLPPEVAQIRSQYKVILFLDEYFRQTSSNVRNILRGILNGKIGNDKVPPGTFIVYASNLADSGGSVEDIPLNADFKKLDFDTPSKDEWFHYFVSKFEKDEKVKLKPEVVNGFYGVLEDGHMSHNDIESEIRTSPRRWEQLLLYINANVPVANAQEASELLTNVRANFKDQENTSSLYKIVGPLTKQIIEKTSGIASNSIKELSDTEWRSIIEHQIKTKMKLGDHRSYIPLIQGMPGIGKTAQALQIADDLNLRLIAIDASTLSVDDITGIPLPDQSKGKEQMQVDFSPPALYQQITNQMKESDADYAQHNSKEEVSNYNQQEYKYLVFFDEINRVKSVSVFNALRRVILEKTFTDTLRIPKDAIIMAAMNPKDKGTLPLTDHLSDVVDKIDTAPSWSKLSEYLQHQANSEELQAYPTNIKNLCLKLIHAFADQFTPKLSGDNGDSVKFFINLKNAGNIYISPREYSTLYDELVLAASRAFKKPYEDLADLQNNIQKSLSRKFEQTLSWIFTKHEVDSPQFIQSVKDWLASSGIIERSMSKQRTTADLTGILNSAIANPNKHLKDDLSFNSYVQTFEVNKFSEDFGNFLDQFLAKKDDKIAWIRDKTHAKKKVEKGEHKVIDETVSEMEFIAREIINACKIHDLSNDVIDQAQSVITDKISKAVENDEELPMDDFLSLLDHIGDMHKSFKNG